ncbi:hypothetical protein [Sapientia aquatica]|uniref:Uncharacterized protein n=1 Tax=Sapientia aquatica TaxID=1549640 RepID=A0A4R5VLN1_9BURK|nr:hypothetical protein [Sapientia aquatica]TDK58988.1 hypothetical protein E2I14_19000 [Sapientia aquatica]
MYSTDKLCIKLAFGRAQLISDLLEEKKENMDSKLEEINAEALREISQILFSIRDLLVHTSLALNDSLMQSHTTKRVDCENLTQDILSAARDDGNNT